MSSSGRVTETAILHLTGADRLDAADSPTKQAFLELTNTVRAQDGFICQYWGHQVENPGLFVWCIDWETVEHHYTFMKSEQYKPFMEEAGQLFDRPFMLHTRWISDHIPAFEAPVTEVAFFTMIHGNNEAIKNEINEGAGYLYERVMRYGNASGAALGWTFETIPPVAPETKPGQEWLAGVFGYPSIEHHMQWRQHSEHDKIKENSEDPKNEHMKSVAAKVPGIDPDTGYFHVKFQKGV